MPKNVEKTTQCLYSTALQSSPGYRHFKLAQFVCTFLNFFSRILSFDENDLAALLSVTRFFFMKNRNFLLQNRNNNRNKLLQVAKSFSEIATLSLRFVTFLLRSFSKIKIFPPKKNCPQDYFFLKKFAHVNCQKN